MTPGIYVILIPNYRYSKYSRIRSKKLFSFLPGLGLKFGESCNLSSSARSSLLNDFGVHMLICTN